MVLRPTGPVRVNLPPPGDPYVRPDISPNDLLDPTLDGIRDAFVAAPTGVRLDALLDAFDRIRSDRRELLIDLDVLNLDLPAGTDDRTLTVALVEARRLRDETVVRLGKVVLDPPNGPGVARTPSSPDASPGPPR